MLSVGVTPQTGWQNISLGEETNGMWAVQKVSSHSEYLENRSCDLDVTWHVVREDVAVHP